MMNPSWMVLAFAASVLTACGGGGGGGGGGGAVRPDIVPVNAANSGTTTEPMTTAPPPFDSTGTYVNLTTVAVPTRVATGSTATLLVPPGTFRPEITVSSVPSVRVVIPELGADDTFAAADLSGTMSGVPVFTKTAGGVTRTLTYFAPGQTGLTLQFSNLGVWEQTDVAAGALVQSAAISYGSRTLGTDIPVTGTAAYNGWMIGSALEGADRFSLWAIANATADFGTRNISLATQSTLKTNHVTGLATPDVGYNLTGTLTYPPGVNALSGSVATANGKTGPASGSFYGPQAAELGVTFRATSAGGANPMIGGAAMRR